MCGAAFRTPDRDEYCIIGFEDHLNGLCTIEFDNLALRRAKDGERLQDIDATARALLSYSRSNGLEQRRDDSAAERISALEKRVQRDRRTTR